MADTPRTDAVYQEATKLGPGGWAIIPPGAGLCDPWELARQLERELAEARKDAQRLEWLMNGGIDRLPYRDHGAGPEFDLSRAAIDAAMRTTAPRL